MTPSAAERWRDDLAAWAIPPEILAAAPESPWIHPVEMFTVSDVVPDSVSHQRARSAVPEGGTVLDVGCGGGRAAVALVPPATSVLGVDEQQPMLDRFAEAVTRAGAAVSTVLGQWPYVADHTPVAVSWRGGVHGPSYSPKSRTGRSGKKLYQFP